MSRSRWYERRKDRFGEQLAADFRARRDDWRSWAPMAIPNRKKRHRRCRRTRNSPISIEALLDAWDRDDIGKARRTAGASTPPKATVPAVQEEPLTNRGGDPYCNLPKTW